MRVGSPRMREAGENDVVEERDDVRVGRPMSESR